MTTKNRIKCYMKTGLYDEAEKSFFVWVNIFSMCIVCVLVLVLEVYPKLSALKSEKNAILGSRTV